MGGRGEGGKKKGRGGGGGGVTVGPVQRGSIIYINLPAAGFLGGGECCLGGNIYLDEVWGNCLAR